MVIAGLLNQFLSTDKKSCPCWPPDLFAVAATLVERTGYYMQVATERGSWKNLRNKLCKEAHADGQKWGMSLESIPNQIMANWDTLVKYETKNLPGPFSAFDSKEETLGPREKKEFCEAAMYLMVAADEACYGIGFVRPTSRVKCINMVGWIYLESFKRIAKSGIKGDGPWLPYLPSSLCRQVKPAVACVQPKGLAPLAGWSMGRFCNHLSLLSTPQSAKTNWFPYRIDRTEEDTLPDKTVNVLVVPFPYSVSGSDFSRVRDEARTDLQGLSGPSSGHVGGTQSWATSFSPKEISEFLVDLVAVARNEVGRVHVVILPELALESEAVPDIISTLYDQTKLALFVTGVMVNDPTEDSPPPII